VTLYLASLARVGHQYYDVAITGHCRLVPTGFACAALWSFVRGYRIAVSRFIQIVGEHPAARGPSR
jgi:hypothetical protein